VWTRSEGIDPFLRIEDAAGAVLKEDDDDGGRPTPWVVLEVAPHRAIVVTVAAGSARHDARLRGQPRPAASRRQVLEKMVPPG
jgi:hypothetical protein